MTFPQSCSRPLSLRFVSFVVFLALALAQPFCVSAAAQQLVTSTGHLRFADVSLGNSEQQIVGVTNTGTTSVTISSVRMVGSGAFSVPGLSLPVVLGSGQSTSLTVQFAPTQTGWNGGTVYITSNASNRTLQFTLAGTGMNAVQLTAQPSAVSFGQVAAGSSKTISVQLTNVRDGRLTLTGFQPMQSNFSVSGPSLPMVLARGQSTQLSITFSPPAAGVMGGSIFIAGPNVGIPVSGQGTLGTAGSGGSGTGGGTSGGTGGGTSGGTGGGTGTSGQLTITPSQMNFGNVNVGSQAMGSFNMSAVGKDVTITSASSSSALFTISGASFPMTIPAGQGAAFNVMFSPAAGGVASGTLIFASTALNTPTTASLMGAGVAPQYSVNLSWSPSTSSVAGYNVYRGTVPGTYSKINTSLDPNTAYSDNTVASGVTYYYAATAVNSSGQESSYSSPLQVSVP